MLCRLHVAEPESEGRRAVQRMQSYVIGWLTTYLTSSEGQPAQQLVTRVKPRSRPQMRTKEAPFGMWQWPTRVFLLTSEGLVRHVHNQWTKGCGWLPRKSKEPTTEQEAPEARGTKPLPG